MGALVRYLGEDGATLTERWMPAIDATRDRAWQDALCAALFREWRELPELREVQTRDHDGRLLGWWSNETTADEGG